MEQATKEHTFITKYPHQRLVIEPERPLRNANGQKIGSKPGRAIEFQGNVLTVKADEIVTVDKGDIKRHEDGSPEFAQNGDVIPVRTPMPLVEWLESHPLFNVDFYERGRAPDEPKPTISEQVADVSRAASVEEVEAVVAVERETHNRDVVFEAAAAALDRLAGDGDAPDEEKAPSPLTSFEQSST